MELGQDSSQRTFQKLTRADQGKAARRSNSLVDYFTSHDAALTASVPLLAYTALLGQPLNDSVVMWMGG